MEASSNLLVYLGTTPFIFVMAKFQKRFLTLFTYQLLEQAGALAGLETWNGRAMPLLCAAARSAAGFWVRS